MQKKDSWITFTKGFVIFTCICLYPSKQFQSSGYWKKIDEMRLVWEIDLVFSKQKFQSY